jgi:hypothetical protein
MGWIPVAAAFSGSASPTVDEQLSFCPFRVTNKKPKSEKNSTRITIMVESEPNKILYRRTKATHLIEVLQELYICDPTTQYRFFFSSFN